MGIEKPEDIQITDEMIEAGIDFFTYGYADDCTRRTVARMYQAMRYAEIKNTVPVECLSKMRTD